ncbi:MAG: hypothetical protein ACI892_002296, partial [Marinobacter maritimus]
SLELYFGISELILLSLFLVLHLPNFRVKKMVNPQRFTIF